jgi:hypothetical protein
MSDRLHIPEDFQLAAKKGAALLDEHHPGWARAIHQINLDLGDSTYCVLGQLYGDYHRGLSELEIPDSDELGFNLVVRRPWDWVKLTKAWVGQIRERL